MQACQKFYSQNLSGAELVQILNDLLFCSVSVKQSTIQDLHPVCVLNSIKNLIGDDRENPSKLLLEFASNYLCGFEFRDDDETQLDDVVRDGIGLTAFLGDLEDACQQGEWEDLQILTAKTFMASDRSRGTMDAFAELALQDCERSAIFIFHLLRAYQFQEIKEDNWAFTKCILEWLRGKALPQPHDQADSSPSEVHDLVIESGDLSLLGAVSRLWEGDYVRIRGYQREISHWCSQTFLTTLNIKPSLNHWLLKDKRENLSMRQKPLLKVKSPNQKKQIHW